MKAWYPLAAMTLLLSGCPVSQFYSTASLTEGEMEISCSGQGLHVNGQLSVAVTIDEADPDRNCDWWTIDFTTTNYRACCDNECCTWGTSEQSEGLAQLSESCEWSGMCEFGLTCYKEDPSDGSGTCELSKLGESCDSSHHCLAPLFCGGGTCIGHVAVSGEQCNSGWGINPCEDPMQCVCPTGQACRCWEGVKGDPCSQGTCQAGLNCIAATGGDKQSTTPRCVEGALGDPCYYDIQCLDDLVCKQTSLGHICIQQIPEYSPCDTEPVLEWCANPLVCNTGYQPPICVAPGDEGALCTLNSDCQPNYRCLEGINECWAGLPGDPCGSPGDCVGGSLCLQVENNWRCVQHLLEGDTCLPDSTNIICGPGLLCNEGFSPPRCATPGQDKNTCGSDTDCAPGYFCLLDLSQCYDGKDNDPCSTADDCAQGYKCFPDLAKCFDGNTGDSCLSDANCAPGYQCHIGPNQCFYSGHGLECEVDDDCLAGLICIPVNNLKVCFEYLLEDAICGLDGPPFSLCDKDLVCDYSQAPPRCINQL